MAIPVRDFQVPEVVPDREQEAQYANEWADHFGIMVGGVATLAWDGIGENAVGHSAISRRVWMHFTRLRVGMRNEFDGALDLPEHAVQLDWATNAARLKDKSPRACAGDVLATFRPQGFCVPRVLIGHANPAALCEKVWPRETRDNFRLYEHIAYFEGFQTADPQEASLASALLEACYMCQGYIQEYVRTLKTEIESKLGLKNLNDPLKELFYEINEPLPEHKTALVAQQMGREIVKGDERKDNAIVDVLTKLSDRLDRMEASQMVQGQPAQIEEATTETSNAQTRRGPIPPKSK